MANSLRLVWFRVLDASDGTPFRRTTADAVSMPSDHLIVQFRHAVKAKHMNKLSSVDAADLLVYRDMDSFEKRKNGVDPLEEDMIIDDLGKCKLEALIVAVPTVKHTTEASALPLFALKKEMPAPSSFARHKDKGCWVNFLRQHQDALICHRYNSEDPGVPVCLLSPRFMEFVHDLDHIAITAQDCEFVFELTDAMCGSFNDEDQRMCKFIELFQEYTGFKLCQMYFDRSSTDGTLVFRNGAIYCNLEVKVEKGSGGGDPYMQCIAFYVKSLPSDVHQKQYPCFLLELCGTAFSVSGIVNTDNNIVCDPLSPTYQLLCNQDFVFLTKLARLFASLRKHLIILQGGFGGLLRASSFPFPSSFRDQTSNSEIGFIYKQQLKEFLFDASLVEQNVEVVVKFCSRYNPDVHRYCHSLGFAPALYSVQNVGNYIMVVMEKLSSFRQLSREDVLNESIRMQIRLILEKLKEKRYVHGDMRQANVLVDTLGNRVVLIDFDWSGIDGVDVYPPFMNPEIAWPDGASTGMPLRHQHDHYWLSEFL